MTDQQYMLRVQAMERRLYRISHAVLWVDSDCADAIQEAVFKGWMKRNSLREEKYFETWLIRILINECRNLQRRQKIRTLPLNEETGPMADDTMAEDMLLRQSLRLLPEKYRMPLLLHHLEGYGLQDIARMLNLTPSLVKSRLSQARKALRKSLQKGEDNP